MTWLELWWQRHLDQKCYDRGYHKWKWYSTVVDRTLFEIRRCSICGEVEIGSTDGVHHV